MILDDLSDMDKQMSLKAMQLFFQNCYDAIIICKGTAEAHSIIYANQAFLTMTGYRQEDILGRSPKILQGPRTNRNVIKRLKSALIENRPFEGATLNYRKSGDEYPVQWRVYPIDSESDSQEKYYVSFQKDLSGLKRGLSKMKASNVHFRQFLSELINMPSRENNVSLSLVNEIEKSVKPQEPQVLDDDFDLFDMDASPGDAAEHSQQREKVNSAAFWQTAIIEDDDILIIDSLIDALLGTFIGLTQNKMVGNDWNDTIYDLQELANSIFYIEEFIDMSIAISELTVYLAGKQLEAVPDFVIECFVALMQDLKSWASDVLVQRTAEDIHFYDDSIISATKQIMMLTG